MNVSRNDSGVYRCFAENKIGIVNNEVKIEVACESFFMSRQ